MSAPTLTALEALAAGAVVGAAAGQADPPLTPLVPEWDGEVSLERYVQFLEGVTRRLAERGVVIEVEA